MMEVSKMKKKNLLPTIIKWTPRILLVVVIIAWINR